MIARTTPSRAPTSRSTRDAPLCTVSRASPLHGTTGGASVRGQANSLYACRQLGREAALLLLLFRPCSAGSRPPEGSGLNSCSPLYTTTNVSLRGRRAVGLPPRQRSWPAGEA